MFEQVRVDREVFGKGESLLICGSVMKLPESSAHWRERYSASMWIRPL